MKDEMYTYHYFKNRAITGVEKGPGYFVQTVILGGIIYITLAVAGMFM